MNTNSIYLYEVGSDLRIPTEGTFLKIDYRGDDRTTTILNTGEQQIVLNGRFLQTSYDGVFDGE
jgi:hypothetical protein